MLIQVLTLMMVGMVAIVSAGGGVDFARARNLKRDAVEGECGIGNFGGVFKSIALLYGYLHYSFDP